MRQNFLADLHFSPLYYPAYFCYSLKAISSTTGSHPIIPWFSRRGENNLDPIRVSAANDLRNSENFKFLTPVFISFCRSVQCISLCHIPYRPLVSLRLKWPSKQLKRTSIMQAIQLIQIPASTNSVQGHNICIERSSWKHYWIHRHSKPKLSNTMNANLIAKCPTFKGTAFKNCWLKHLTKQKRLIWLFNLG